jgi:histidinol phosphatase-like PHP family hydrolase
MPATRIDLHTHTFFSDGELLPSEIVRRAVTLGYAAIALTDHADASNLEQVLAQLTQFCREQRGDFPLVIIPGIELTHVAPERIAPLAKRAKDHGAALVVVHGETIVEPVAPGTDRAAVECADVDILAHPGFITLEEARLAVQNNIALEITARKGHSLTNGHVAQIARAAGAMMVVDTDTHSPSDMIDQEFARKVARGAGLSEEEIDAATETNPRILVERAKARLTKK